MSKGRAQKGQKWDPINLCWYWPEGVTPPVKTDKAPVVAPVTSAPVEKKDLVPVDHNQPITMEMVNKLLSEQRTQIMADLGREGNLNVPVVEGGRHQPLAKNAIPENDLNQKPRYYYAWGRFLYIDAYNDRGRDVNPPYMKPIVLKPMPPQVEIDGMGKRKELHWCTVELWSKKEIEFIEGHPYFAAGLIMTSANDLKYEDARRVTMKAQVVSEVSKFNKVEIIDMCRNRHITVDNDFTRMRNALIESFANERMDNMKRSQVDAVKRSNAELLGAK